MDLSESTALLQACLAGDDASVARLLAEGRVAPERCRDAEGCTPLMRAVQSGSSRCVNLLLATGGAAQLPLQSKVRARARAEGRPPLPRPFTHHAPPPPPPPPL
jgi:hypothetical protein